MKLKKVEKQIECYKLVYYVDASNQRQGELKQLHLRSGKLHANCNFKNDALSGDLIYYNDKGAIEFIFKVFHNPVIEIENYNNKAENIRKIMTYNRTVKSRNK